MLDKFVKSSYISFCMFQPFTVTARDVLRHYKKVINKVKDTRRPAIIMSQKQPQAVIVSLEDFEKLQALRYKKSAKVLLDAILKIRELLKDEKLPADLSEKHDYYIYK